MKIAEYNQMMAYLTRPEPLPQPKPEELLEIQEQKRKDRLRKTMEEIGPGLMDESVDFIERENFAIKGLTDQQLLDLGFSKQNLEPAKRSYQKLAEIFQQADIDDELEYLLEKSKNYPKGKIESTLRNVLQKLPEDEKGLKYIASLLGEDVEFVLDMIDDKKILAATGRDEKRLAKQLEKSERLRKEFGQVEKWMLKNASKYSDPKKFKNATIDRFGKKNAAIKAMTSGGGNFFSDEFNNNILGYKGTSDFAKINKSIGDNIFRTTIYNFNPNVRKAITNEFKSILSGGPAQVKAEARSRIKKSKLFKQFGLTEKIHGPISRLIYKEVGEELYKNLSAFRNPRVGTVNLIQYLEGVVDPKYKSQFKEARIAMEAAGKNEFKKAKQILGRTDKIMFDHKIPSSFIDAGYADPIEYIKVTPATENFNVKIKNKQYDVPVMKLLNKFEKATTPEAKQVIYNTILEKHNNFSKKYGGYLDNVKPELTDGKIKFSSSAAPVTKQTDFVKEFAKAGLQTGELKTKDTSKITKLIASIACPGKAMGGRVDFQEGTSCFEKGKKMINTGKIPEGAAKRNFISFANKAMEIGKQSGRGLRTITKFGIIPEAIIIGADTLIRAGMGDTFNEAFKRASDIYRTDEAYEQADASEINRRMNSNDGELILNLRKFNREKQKLDSIEQAKAADLALAGDEFGDYNIGMTEEEIEKLYAPRLQEQKNNVFNASISDAEERAGLAKEMEFADKKGVAYKQSPVGKFLDYLGERPGFKQAVDLFATGVRGEPDVSAQVLENYLSGKIPQEEEKELRNIIDSGGARGVLDAMKKIESSQQVPEGAIREPNVFDEERKILFELAKTDPALAERLGGANMTFFGDPINTTDLQDEMNLDRGIYALGGRIGFADGPKNPGRRTFMKILAGIASLPVIGKLLKPAAPAIQKLANTSTKMPDWFPDFINKISFSGFGKKIDADVTLFETKQLPGVQVYRHDDGRVFVEGTNEYGKGYKIEYEPPGYEVMDYDTGKTVKKPGEFIAEEEVPVNVDPDGNADFDVEVLDDLDQILGPDTRAMEEFATGKKNIDMKKGEFQVGKAEADADVARDLEDLDDFYED